MTILINEEQTSSQIHVGDIGTNFIATIYKQDGTVMDLSAATSMKFIFLSPDRVVTEHNAQLYTDGKDGKLVYGLQAGDIDIGGTWSYQVEVVFAAGTWRTNVVSFPVYENIPPFVPPV